jgi:hypothetical protein
MKPIPAQVMRTNLGTWAVPDCELPAIAARMTGVLPSEPYDPDFAGQKLKTVYFDTPAFDLRKARARKDKYLTLRLRCYVNEGSYALSVKTESEKYRVELPRGEARALLRARPVDPAEEFGQYLPAHLLTRLLEISRDQPLVPTVCLRAYRYAVENEQDRLTLDTDIATITGRPITPRCWNTSRRTSTSRLPTER